MSKRTRYILIGIVVAILAAIGLYNIPFIHQKLAWRIEDLQTQIYYFFNPPEEATFVPVESDRITLVPSATRTTTPGAAPPASARVAACTAGSATRASTRSTPKAAASRCRDIFTGVSSSGVKQRRQRKT